MTAERFKAEVERRIDERANVRCPRCGIWHDGYPEYEGERVPSLWCQQHVAGRRERIKEHRSWQHENRMAHEVEQAQLGVQSAIEWCERHGVQWKPLPLDEKEGDPPWWD